MIRLLGTLAQGMMDDIPLGTRDIKPINNIINNDDDDDDNRRFSFQTHANPIQSDVIPCKLSILPSMGKKKEGEKKEENTASRRRTSC